MLLARGQHAPAHQRLSLEEHDGGKVREGAEGGLEVLREFGAERLEGGNLEAARAKVGKVVQLDRRGPVVELDLLVVHDGVHELVEALRVEYLTEVAGHPSRVLRLFRLQRHGVAGGRRMAGPCQAGR